MLSSDDVIGLTDLTIRYLSACSALFNMSISRSRYRNLSLSQSDGDLLSAKIEQSSVLVNDAYR